MNEKKKSPEFDGREIPLLLILVGGGVWYRYGYTAQVWFHDNLIKIALVGIGGLALGGFLLVRKFTKKNEADISRIKKLHDVKGAAQAPERYYERESFKAARHE